MEQYSHLIVDWLSALSLLALMVLIYEDIRTTTNSETAAHAVMGGLFGVVTVVQMHMPVAPIDGVIVDLRNVPIVLAGAFLGLPGLVPCLLIAVFARFGIGGEGMIAGTVAMGLSAMIGMLWNLLGGSNPRRSVPALFALGAMTLFTMPGAALMPRDAALWFYTHAAPALGLCYIVVIPLFAALLQRQMYRRYKNMRMPGIPPDRASRYMSMDRLEREALQVAASGTSEGIAGFATLRDKDYAFMAQIHGPDAAAHRQGDLADAVAEDLRFADLIAMTRQGKLVVPLTADEMARFAQILSDKVALAPEMGELEFDLLAVPSIHAIAPALRMLDRAFPHGRKKTRLLRKFKARQARIGAQESLRQQDQLFGKVDALMAARKPVR